MIESSRRDAETRRGLRQVKSWLVSVCGSEAFPKIIGKRLDFSDNKNDFICSMPAEPLSFLGKLMLNSGGFFYAWTVPGKEPGHG